MNVKYLRMRATAQRLIRENGTKVNLRRLQQGEYDKETDSYPEPTYLEQALWCVVLPPKYKGQEQLFSGETGGILDYSSVKNVLLSTQDMKFVPESLDDFQYKGEWWKLDQLSSLDPDAETDILYKGIIRRS